MKNLSKIALAAMAGLVILYATKKKSSGIGAVDFSDFYGARIITEDNRHAVDFRIENGDTIVVTAMMPTSVSDRDYMEDFEYWFTIGRYKTFAGAKRAAKSAMDAYGYVLNDNDLAKI